jgi:predicted phosphodiesterase
MRLNAVWVYNPPGRSPPKVNRVRILLLSDIHSNLEALEACLTAAPDYDVVANLGDVVGYGASPNEVISRSRGLGKFFVRGNHDKAVAGLMDLTDFNPVAGMAALWTRSQLIPENLEWLRELPQGPLRLDNVIDAQFVHGSPLDEDEYVVSARDADEPLSTSAVAVTFFGHSHIQGVFRANHLGSEALRPAYETLGQTEACEFALEKNGRYLVNPGSVGQPRDGDWRAAFGVFDTENFSMIFYRVPYNLKAAQDRIFAANLPQRLATRLAAGR